MTDTTMPTINTGDAEQMRWVRDWLAQSKPGFRLELRGNTAGLGEIFSGFFGDSFSTKPTSGVWCAYERDGSAAAVFPSEVEALRYALERCMRARTVEWGEDIFTGPVGDVKAGERP